MTARIASTLRRYAVAPAAVAAVLGVTLALRVDAAHVSYPLFLVVVGGCAFAGGIRAGLIATACCLLFIGYLLRAPVDEIQLANPTVLIFAFAFACVVLSVLLGTRARIESERDELSAAVAMERERLETILDSAHIGIGFLDSRLRYLQANDALADINGLPVRDHVGRRVQEVAPWIPDGILALLAGVLEGRSAIGVEVAIGAPRFVEESRHFVVSFLPIRDSNGGVIGVGFTVNDVSLLKRSEAEQARLLARAEEAQRAADAANHMKDEFLMTLSHEMRSPLQGILGWNRLLRGGELDAKQAEQASETIERIVRQQAELLNGLFDVSRIVAGKMEIAPSRVDLAELVRQAFHDQQFSARRHGISLGCDAAGIVPASADPERIHQVLTNLLTNAIKFTPAGGRVDLRCIAEAGEGVITVTDTGDGIEPEFLQHIFERFSQADRSRARRHRGLGLGLSIVYHLVELHGGSVAATSPGPGRGTTVTVRLPLATGLAGPGAPAPLERISGRAYLNGIRILLVEDDVNVRESTVALLELRAARVTTAPTASAGVTAFLESKPHVVVSDLGLPGEDGYSFLRRLRAIDTNGDVPVIAFSGHASAAERDRCLAAGFTAHLTKPVDPEILVQAIAQTLVAEGGRS